MIAGRANALLAGKRGGKSPVHPNDHVNRGQSSNDSFPSAMHIAAGEQAARAVVPPSSTCSRRSSVASLFPGMVHRSFSRRRHPATPRPPPPGLPAGAGP